MMGDNSDSELEASLSQPDDQPDYTLLDNNDGVSCCQVEQICKDNNLDITNPKLYISKTDKFFQDIMDGLKASSESDKLKINLVPKFKNKKLDGFFLSFSKKFD